MDEHPLSFPRHRDSGRDRIHGAGRVRHGRIHAHVRAARQELHSDADRVRLFGSGRDGDPDDRQRERPPDHDHGRAVHQLRRAAADLFDADPGVFRAEVSGAGHVDALFDRNHRRARLCAGVEILDFQGGGGGFRDGTSSVSAADVAQHPHSDVGKNVTLSAEGRYADSAGVDHPLRHQYLPGEGRIFTRL